MMSFTSIHCMSFLGAMAICCHCGLGCVVREQYLLHVFLTIDHGYVSWGGDSVWGHSVSFLGVGGWGGLMW